MKKLLVIVLLTLFFVHDTTSQDKLILDNLSIEDGLPDREVSQVVKDNNGFIWIATSFGISRFDGYDFLNFNSENTETITDDRITALLVVEDKLWVGTQSNLLILNLKTYEWKEYKKIAVTRLFKDSKNQVWLVGNQDEVFCILKNGTLKKIEETQSPEPWVRAQINSINTMGEGSEGVWWGRLDGTLRQYSEKKGKVNVVFNGDQFKKRGSAFLDQDTLIWHSTNDHLKLFHINGHEIPIKHHNLGSLTRAASMSKLQNGSILLTDFENRILELNSAERKTIFHEKQSHSLSTKSTVNSLLQDDNLLWLATNSGLYKVDFQSSHFNKILHYNQGLNSIRYIAELENDEILVSSYTGLHFLNERNKVDSIVKKPWYAFYEMIPKADNTYWTASEGTGLLEFNSKDRTIKHLTYTHESGGHPARYLTSLVETDSLIYIGEYKGLYSYDKFTGIMEEVKNEKGNPSLIGERINDLHLDNKGELWIASDKGLYVLDTLTGNCEFNDFSVTGSKNYEARVIFETSDNKLWFGTRQHGLLMLDEQRKKLSQWKKQDGLAFDAVNTIISSDNDRYLWIGTNLGLSQFDRSTNTFTNYFEKDGISNNEFNKHAVLNHSNGLIYIGGINGVNIFDPSKLTKKFLNKKMMLTAFSKYDGDERKVVHQKTQITNQRSFTLAPKDRFFSIYFALDNYYSVEKNQFRYKIESLHENWVDLGTQNKLVIDNLEAGEYVVKIQGTSGEGQWSDNELAIQLTIEEVFYKKVWFLLLVFIVILFIGWIGHKIRIRQLLKLERMKTKIARDLHDELGSSLTRISMYSELAKENGQRLDQLSVLSKEATSTLSDIVWSIDSENNTLEELIGRMRDHLHIMVKHTTIDFDFKAGDLDQQIMVKTEAKQNLFLIFKEAINNILKHAKASFIKVMIYREKNNLVMSIQNDGANLSDSKNEPRKGGKGTKSMQNRSEALKGSYKVLKKHSFYQVLITIPIKSL
ncbi:MAG: ligand-binding sensor domain-containing protein [Bacteroidota bacterium]